MLHEIRDGDRLLCFDGAKVASVSAELPTKDRWTELEVYITVAGQWVLAGVGRSRVPGEIDRHWAVTSDNPVDIVAAIVGHDTSWLAKRLLSESLLALLPAGISGTVAGL